MALVSAHGPARCRYAIAISRSSATDGRRGMLRWPAAPLGCSRRRMGCPPQGAAETATVGPDGRCATARWWRAWVRVPVLERGAGKSAALAVRNCTPPLTGRRRRVQRGHGDPAVPLIGALTRASPSASPTYVTKGVSERGTGPVELTAPGHRDAPYRRPGDRPPAHPRHGRLRHQPTGSRPPPAAHWQSRFCWPAARSRTPNAKSSTVLQLATWTTGRGGVSTRPHGPGSP